MWLCKFSPVDENQQSLPDFAMSECSRMPAASQHLNGPDLCITCVGLFLDFTKGVGHSASKYNACVLQCQWKGESAD